MSCQPISSFTHSVVSESSQLGNNNHLNVLYFNARSLLPKLSELQLIANAYSPSIICIVETWLCPDISDMEVSLPGYHIVHLDRNRNGGRVLMYVSANLQFSVQPTWETQSCSLSQLVQVHLKLVFHSFIDHQVHHHPF